MPSAATKLKFSVDAALFRELGERLVGKPHIALAELIKNSYDADATEVRIRFDDDLIEVSDNGNGMDVTEFKNFWMRVGSPHKQQERISPRLRRPLTGSKGVGRLAVQFLASEVEIQSSARGSAGSELVASVDWRDAVRAKELTKATATIRRQPTAHAYPGGSKHGTRILLTNLQHRWLDRELEALAREIWWLQPPFLPNPRKGIEDAQKFHVQLEHGREQSAKAFDRQMQAVLGLWYARVKGRLDRPAGKGVKPGKVHLTLEFAGGESTLMDFEIPECELHSADFEIRIFNLAQRQGRGIKVEQARQYFREFGGVHVYDAGFHLPYYGPDTDWLQIEIDHSHRLSRSKLLPAQLQVSEGLNNLPTQSRIFGVVHVDTAAEQQAAGAHRREYLKIQVSRDRLVDNRAFEQLSDMVRWALDFYAMKETLRKHKEVERLRPVEPLSRKVSRVDDVLERHRDQVPKNVYVKLKKEVTETIHATESEAESTVRRMGLLGALATAGVAALGFDHEITKQLHALETLASDLNSAQPRDKAYLRHAAESLREWVRRVRGTRSLFSHLIDEENREKRARFRARALVEDVRDQMGILLRGVVVDASGIDRSLRLPDATFAEWSAVFQNLLMNSVNALVDSGEREISISSRTRGKRIHVLVQDTGRGVDIDDAERLFQPFERGTPITAERRALGLGGTGLGLTIVRMICDNLGTKTAFVEPDPGYSTAVELAWTEV